MLCYVSSPYFEREAAPSFLFNLVILLKLRIPPGKCACAFGDRLAGGVILSSSAYEQNESLSQELLRGLYFHGCSLWVFSGALRY